MKHQVHDWTIIFEYELPREGGRRPDVVLLNVDSAIIIEVKDKRTFITADIDQTRAYVRDIKEYHLESRDLKVSGLLFLLQSEQMSLTKSRITIIGLKSLSELIRSLNVEGMSEEKVGRWINSLYEPLPSLIDAAKMIFTNEPLPNIRSVQSAGIPQALATLHKIVNMSRNEGDRRLILISGAPGSGKTLVGLQFVHEYSSATEIGVFLSGNGPLVNVLQDALRSKVFVQDVHRFIREHGIHKTPLTKEHVLIFDEAQRAWDRNKVQDWNIQRYNRPINKSEPELFIDIATQIADWGLMIGLIGYGQEIHNGEEGGVEQWYDAIRNSPLEWKVHCPPRFAQYFDNSQIKVYLEKDLDLTISLRSHVAETMDIFTESLLIGNLYQAKTEAEYLKASGFSLLVTSDMEEAQAYMQERYNGEELKTYGIVASSQSKNLAKYGFDTGFKSRQTVSVRFPGDIKSWFNKPNDIKGCKSFNKIATEFICQGLELDGVIIAWGEDVVWDGKHWATPKLSKRLRAKNPRQLRINSYRVLLTRSRDGLVIYCPTGDEMKETYFALLDAGFEDIIQIPQRVESLSKQTIT